MKQDDFIGISFFYSVLDGKWDSHADNKHEKGLDQIPKVQSMPFMVSECCCHKLPNGAAFHRLKMPVKPGAFAYQKKHRDTAKQINRSDPPCCRGSGIV